MANTKKKVRMTREISANALELRTVAGGTTYVPSALISLLLGSGGIDLCMVYDCLDT